MIKLNKGERPRPGNFCVVVRSDVVFVVMVIRVRPNGDTEIVDTDCEGRIKWLPWADKDLLQSVWIDGEEGHDSEVFEFDTMVEALEHGARYEDHSYSDYYERALERFQNG